MGEIDQFPDFVRQFTAADVPFEGATAWFVQGSQTQIVFMEFSEAASVPEHSHQEQWELVLAGSVRLRMGGQESEFRAGDNFFIPAGVVHSAEVDAGYRAIIVFNEPDRYKAF